MRTTDSIRRANLQALVSEAGSQAALSRKTGKDKNQIWQWLIKDESNPQYRAISKSSARELEAATGKPKFWMDEDHTVTVAAPENEAGYIRLPLLEIAVSAGTGANVDGAESEVVQYLDVADWWAKSNLPHDLDRVRVISARGDSMAPDIQHGDVLFVDIGTRAFDAPGLYVLNWQGRALVKRLVPELRTGRLILHSTNPAYPPESVDPTDIDQLHIAGRVTAAWTLKRY